MSLSEPVGEGVVLYHPVVVKYAKYYDVCPDAVVKGFQEALEDPDKIMYIPWARLSLDVGSDVKEACSKTYNYGWEHDEETKKLRSLFKSLVKPINEEIRLEDWM